MKRLRLGVLSIIAVTAMALAPPGSAAVEETMKNPVQIQTFQIAAIATMDVSMVSLDQNVTASTIADRTHQPIGWVTPLGVNAIKSSGATTNTFSSTTKSALVSTNGTDTQNAAHQKALPAVAKKRGVRANAQARSNRHLEGRHRLTAARIDVDVSPNRGQIIQV